MRKYILSLLLISFLTGCNVSKYIPKNEKLFYGSEIKMQADSTIGKDEVSELQGQLEELARPNPNGRILGFPLKVWFYYYIGEPKKENGLRAWLRRKLGQPPVFASAKALSSNSLIFNSHLENNGYFRSTSQGALVEVDKKPYFNKAVYQVQVQPRYYLDSISTVADSTPAGKALVRESKGRATLLKEGDPYRFDVIKAEQQRIHQRFQQQGFYYFQPNYIAFLADTNFTTRRMRLFLALKPDMPNAAGLQYYIRNIYIYPNYTLNVGGQTEAVNDTNRANSYRYKQFYIVDSTRAYKPKLFEDVVGLRPGRRYNSRAQDLTLSRFINLGTFKFVRNRFQPLEERDTTFLDVHYYLTPSPKKSIRLELAGLTKSNNLAGSQLTLSWRNRNALRQAELFTVNAYAGIDFFIGGGDTLGLTNHRFGLEASMTFPRLVSPIRFRYDRRQLLPKSILTLGYDLIVRRQLYNLNQFRATFAYAWQKNAQIEQTFQPFGVAYVRVANFGPRLYDILASGSEASANEILRILEGSQLILNSVYSVSYNSSPRTSGRRTFRTTFNVEPAGNIAGLLIKDRDEDEVKTLFDVPIAQYVRVDIDNRYYYRLAPSMTWASRLAAGVGAPYGSSRQMPFVKQFFVGGSNSIRAFRPRGVGPGIYNRPREDGQTFVLQDGGGDIKLEASTELRPKFNSFLQGAFFLDVGNVWMFRDTLAYNDGSQFTKNWYKQLAVGTGVGLRLDLSYFVLRFDLAFPLRKPYLPDGQRWVFDQISFGNRQWRRENLILNIAVGYPF